MAIIITNPNWLQVDGARLQKGKWDVAQTSTGVRLSDAGQSINIPFQGTTIDGNAVANKEDLLSFFEAQGFKNGGGAPSVGVQSVTGNIVSGTPENPVVNMPANISAHPARTDNPHSVTATQVGLGNVNNTSDLNKPVSTATQNALNTKQNTSEKGQANGYAPLGADGLVPIEYLNISGLNFLGAWNASTNTPELLDGAGDVGDFYKVSVPGTYNFGNGDYTFLEGDWVIFAAGVWQRLGSSDSVAMVNGKVGAVIINKADVGLSNVDNTSDANKPISNATQTALSGKQAALVSGTNIKTVNGVNILGSGNVNIPVIGQELPSSNVFSNFVRTREYSDRTVYTSKVNLETTVAASTARVGQTVVFLPTGITIEGADEFYISVRTPQTTVKVNVFDNTANGRIDIGYNNPSASSVLVTGYAFIKLVYYK